MLPGITGEIAISGDGDTTNGKVGLRIDADGGGRMNDLGDCARRRCRYAEHDSRSCRDNLLMHFLVLLMCPFQKMETLDATDVLKLL
jgi:hypothetical protein